MSKVAFRVHPKFVYDGIRRQAGTLCKAVLEGVMNSIEAGATRVDITSNGKVLDIIDNGTGIPTKEDIERHFATFGQPHSAGENKIWAQFRMGRGQLFSFGHNTWLTGTHKLVVDVNKWNVDSGDDWNLDFEWLEGQPEVAGCRIHIELYSPIESSYPSLESFQTAVQRQIEFVGVPVFFNGTCLTSDPEKLKWDLEDDDAYYLWAKGSNLTVYNLGALCREFPASTYGVTGIVVSKEQLKVNFARNDIQHDCPVWARIREVLHQNKVKRTRAESRGYLSTHERIATLNDIRDGIQPYDDWSTIALMQNTSGRGITLDFMRKLTGPWTFAPQGDQRADKLIQAEQAVCLSERILDELGYRGDPKRFFSWLVSRQNVSASFRNLEQWYRPFDGPNGLSKSISADSFIIASNKWTPAETRIIKVLSKWADVWQGRKLVIGVSASLAAWTDGRSYISMERNWLKRIMFNGEAGLVELFSVLTHELAHDDDTSHTHIHGEEFYRHFHDLVEGTSTDRYGERKLSPFVMLATFRAEMHRMRIQEKYDLALQKEAKEKERRNKKLGVAVAARVANTQSLPSKPRVSKPKIVRPRGTRRVRI